MIITEEDLAPYRSTLSGVLPFERNLHYPYEQGLPHGMFTGTHEVFGLEWRYPTDGSDPRDTLEVVPVLAFTRSVSVLTPGRKWLALKHQSGGILCEQVKMIAIRLTPRSSIMPSLNAIARENYEADDFRFSKSDLLASRIVSYVMSLNRLGLHCEFKWRHLSESIYPIDATQENLERVAEEVPDLESLADWKGLPALAHHNLTIFLLTQNSD